MSSKFKAVRRFSRRDSNEDRDADASRHHRTSSFSIRPSISSISSLVLGRRLSSRGSCSSGGGLSDDESTKTTLVDTLTRSRAVRAADGAREGFRERLPRSLVEAHHRRDVVAPFLKEEVVLGKRLGSGEFAHVYEVKSFDLKPRSSFLELAADGETAVGAEELERRLELKEHEQYRESKNVRYAVKHIQEDYCQRHSSESYVQAASDLVTEAEFLASLVHPNIIKLRGVSFGGAAGFALGPSGYFLVIDRLFETLEDRIKRWRDPGPVPKEAKRSLARRVSGLRRSSASGASSGPASPEAAVAANGRGRNGRATDDDRGAMDERLGIAVQISTALVYLHKHSIIFRDLKPANIGFDVRGDVKIFDFGLARTVPEGDGNSDRFKMSGAGSPRYMAPECLTGRPYNLKADVYSFSVILWEVLSAATPYHFVRGMRQLVQYVVHEGGRPEIDDKWPETVKGMLESSFDEDMDVRPKMSLWYTIIREALVSLRGGNRKGLTDAHINRRRTMEGGANPRLTRRDVEANA